jgi:hypothetical protein
MKTFIIKNGEDKLRVAEYIKWINLDKPVSVEFKPYKPNRSKAQNRLMWKWIQIMGDDLGYEKDDLHAVLTVKFLGTVDIEAMGEKISQPVSTSKLNVKEFSVYLGRIEVFSHGELGILLPTGDDLYYEAMGIKRR